MKNIQKSKNLKPSLLLLSPIIRASFVMALLFMAPAFSYSSSAIFGEDVLDSLGESKPESSVKKAIKSFATKIDSIDNFDEHKKDLKNQAQALKGLDFMKLDESLQADLNSALNSETQEWLKKDADYVSSIEKDFYEIKLNVSAGENGKRSLSYDLKMKEPLDRNSLKTKLNLLHNSPLLKLSNEEIIAVLNSALSQVATHSELQVKANQFTFHKKNSEKKSYILNVKKPESLEAQLKKQFVQGEKSLSSRLQADLQSEYDSIKDLDIAQFQKFHKKDLLKLKELYLKSDLSLNDFCEGIKEMKNSQSLKALIKKKCQKALAAEETETLASAEESESGVDLDQAVKATSHGGDEEESEEALSLDEMSLRDLNEQRAANEENDERQARLEQQQLIEEARRRYFDPVQIQQDLTVQCEDQNNYRSSVTNSETQSAFVGNVQKIVDEINKNKGTELIANSVESKLKNKRPKSDSTLFEMAKDEIRIRNSGISICNENTSEDEELKVLGVQIVSKLEKDRDASTEKVNEIDQKLEKLRRELPLITERAIQVRQSNPDEIVKIVQELLMNKRSLNEQDAHMHALEEIANDERQKAQLIIERLELTKNIFEQSRQAVSMTLECNAKVEKLKKAQAKNTKKKRPVRALNNAQRPQFSGAKINANTSSAPSTIGPIAPRRTRE